MLNEMKKIIKEPLVHFLLIGLGIFLLYGLTASGDKSRDEIVISDSDLRHMVEMWKLRWQREPTEEELVGLVSATIREEIMYREALKMNLDHDDEVVRRRLAQKMDFLSNDISAMVNKPSDEVLKEYYETNVEKYKLPARYTFQQIVFTPDHHDNPKQEAEKTLERIQGDQVEIRELGDPLSLPYRYTSIYANKLNGELGGEIAGSLENMPVNKWAGPVHSGFGWHLVYIDERQEAEFPAFEDIRNELERDYAYEKEKESQERIYQQLRNGYDINLQLSLSPEISERIMKKING